MQLTNPVLKKPIREVFPHENLSAFLKLVRLPKSLGGVGNLTRLTPTPDLISGSRQSILYLGKGSEKKSVFLATLVALHFTPVSE